MKTHFRADTDDDVTLCGKPWTMVVMNDRPPRCQRCLRAHKPWTFPLPEVVV